VFAEMFYASLPSSFCDKNFALPFYTPGIYQNNLLIGAELRIKGRNFPA